jgi:DNA-binding transcriptional LysR family regulator
MQTTVPDHWLGVEPRHLATFAAVAEAGSFRGAATALGYVQSAVSQQIAHLERALATRLIERGQGNRDLVLTPAGRTLLVHARRIVDHMRAACADVAYLSGSQPLRLAVEPSATTLLSSLPFAVSGDRADGGLSIAELPAAGHPDLVTAGVVDVALGTFKQLGPGFSHQTVGTDRWVLVLPDGPGRDGHRRELGLDELSGKALIEDRSHPLPVSASHLGADRVIGCDRLAVALDLVRAGAGGAVLPRLGISPRERGIRLVEVGDRLPVRPVSLIWLAARRLPGELSQLGPPRPLASRNAGPLRGVA